MKQFFSSIMILGLIFSYHSLKGQDKKKDAGLAVSRTHLNFRMTPGEQKSKKTTINNDSDQPNSFRLRVQGFEMGYSNHIVPGQDTLKFMSVPVKSEEEAKEMLNRAVNAGFGDPPPHMQGEYDGTQLTLEQTRTLHDRARKNREED